MAHDHTPTNFGRLFAIGVVLNLIYVALEAGYGIADNSLALLTDAGHNLSDVIGLLLAWAGHALAKIPPTPQRTYGWRGTSILAALFNALLLLVAVGGIAWEAMRRLADPSEVPGMAMIVVAAIGVVVNTVTALLFLRDRHHDLNIRGAFLHMAADAAVSLGVVLAGFAIRATGWQWIDPATSLVIAAIIFFGTWDLFKKSFNLAMQSVPAEVNATDVQQLLASTPGVAQVHDLHIWAMSTTEIALTAHLVKPEIENDDMLIRELERQLQDRFNIQHVTIQIERSGCEQECALTSGHHDPSHHHHEHDHNEARE